MEVEEAKKMKKELEGKIEKAIGIFEKKTGAIITNIKLTTHESAITDNPHAIIDMMTSVEIITRI